MLKHDLNYYSSDWEVLAFRMEVQIVYFDMKYSVNSFIKGVFGVMWIIYRYWENGILSFLLKC